MTSVDEVSDFEINLKGIFEFVIKDDGFRIFVDRPWPKALKKSEAGVGFLLRDIAASTELRKWFNHEQQRWNEFAFQKYSL